MSTFWVYENWNRDRARVHRGECAFCKHGLGRDGKGPGKDARWRWLGPFTSRGEARRRLRDLARADRKECSFCLPPG